MKRRVSSGIAAILLTTISSVGPSSASATGVDPSQLPRDDSSGPGAAMGNSEAPWEAPIRSVQEAIPIAISNARTETETQACSAGQAGVKFRTRLVKTFTNGVSQSDAWSAWQGQCVAVASGRGIVKSISASRHGSACYKADYTEPALIVTYGDGTVSCIQFGYRSPNGNG